jgi:CheY-like chemotaxis protein
MAVATAAARHRVLIVEDELLVCELLAGALTEQGFEVHAAADAETALRHLARGEPCDVLFTDINLGNGPDGTVLARAARLLRPDLPVVYSSGAVGTLAQIQAVPGSRFVQKPYDPDEVGAMLSMVAAARSPMPGP